MAPKPAFEKNKKRVSPNNQTIGGKKPKIDASVKYADAPAVKPEDTKELSEVREKFAPNADKPTTASGDKGITDLPQLVKQIDPQGKAQVIPQMYQQLMQMTSILSMGSGFGGGGAGGNTGLNQIPVLPSGISSVLEDSFTGALAILVKKYGFERVIQVFVLLLSDNRINLVDSRFRKIVENAMANLIKVCLYYGPEKIPVSTYDLVVFGVNVPDPLVDPASVPDFYQKYYYTLASDPYPGYYEWRSPASTDKVWTKKEENTYHFSSSSQEIYSNSELGLAEDLDQYVKIQTPQPILTIALFNELLIKRSNLIEQDTLNNNMGNNSGSNSGNNGGNNMAGMMGGQLQQLMQLLQSEQLPKSVLNQGEIGKVLQQYTKDMAFNNQLFELGNAAMGGGIGGALGSLGNMGGLSNIMGGFGAGGGGIGGILGNLGGGNLLGSFGGFGGASNGGGGGAGSGFPEASGGGSYSGGNISESGLTNIQTMLTLLGIT
jgi:hypothetical protein